MNFDAALKKKLLEYDRYMKSGIIEKYSDDYNHIEIGSNLHNSHRKSIEARFIKQNMNSVRIEMKFWAKHETRDQAKIHNKLNFVTSFEKAIETIYVSLIREDHLLDRWLCYNSYPSMESYFNKVLFPAYYQILCELSGRDNVVIPNIVLAFYEKELLDKLSLEIREYEKNIIVCDEKINSLTKKIEKKQTKLNKGKLWYAWKWVINKANNKISYLCNLKSKVENLKNDLNAKKEDGLNNSIECSNRLFKYNTTATQYSNCIIGVENTNLNFKPIEAVLNNIDSYRMMKGVYIIWNKTKNLYYVGQSKNLMKRIAQEHFDWKTGMCKNPHFMNHYNIDKDEFLISIILLNTKDELDATEKNYINMFDSFHNGYNKTSGNW